MADLESAHEDLDFQIAEATRPLLRQIEVMAREVAGARDSQTATDSALRTRCTAAEATAEEAVEAERCVRSRLQACEGLLRASKQAASEHLAACSERAEQLESERRRVGTVQAEMASLQERLTASIAETDVLRQVCTLLLLLDSTLQARRMYAAPRFWARPSDVIAQVGMITSEGRDSF